MVWVVLAKNFNVAVALRGVHTVTGNAYIKRCVYRQDVAVATAPCKGAHSPMPNKPQDNLKTRQASIIWCAVVSTA